VAFAGGNKQGGYYGRFRSEIVRTTVGEDIQRHHVHGMARLIQKVMDKKVPLDKVIDLAQCIVVVTKSEHDALHNVDPKIEGWERFGVAKVIVNDMAHDEPRRITEFS
jgi:hypothetical protein